jgi:hypothetical protein
VTPAVAPAITRREALRRVAAAGCAAAGPLILPERVRAQVAPSGRITVAVIGLGAMGSGHLRWCLGHPGGPGAGRL